VTFELWNVNVWISLLLLVINCVTVICLKFKTYWYGEIRLRLRPRPDLLYKSGNIRLRQDFPKANPVQPYWKPLNLQDLKMADKKEQRLENARPGKWRTRAQQSSARVCIRMQKNEWLLFACRTFIFFRIIRWIGLDSNVTDTALNSLFISRACALCGLTARTWSVIFQVLHFPGLAFSVASFNVIDINSTPR